MEKRHILKIIDKLPKSLRQDQIAKLLYIIKAWKILSANGEIESVALNYETFFNNKIEAKKLREIFNSLAEAYKLFYLFVEQENILSKITDQDLTSLFIAVESWPQLILVSDMFYVLLKDASKSSISNQVTELGVKLLGNDCDEIYVPFSDSLNIGYFTDKTVYAESMTDELIIELMKTIDNIDIIFTYTDTLDEPAYINDNAPHLLRQFSCCLSFPPMGLPLGKALKNEDKFNRFKIHKGRGNRDVAHVEHILAQTKMKAVVLLPVGMNYRTGTELELRKYLIDNNLLEAIVQLPSNLYAATSVETTFFIINKNKQDDNVYFINLKDKRFLSKDAKKTVLSDPNEIVKLYKNKEEIENISGLIPCSLITQNNYTFSIDRYIISKKDARIQKQLNKYELIELQDIANIRRSQLFKDEGEGIEIYEISPSDLAKAGFTEAGGKSKFIRSQMNKFWTYALEPFDIVVSTKGTIGKVGLIGASKQHLVASQAMQVIRLKDPSGGAPHRLYMYLKSDVGQSLLKHLVAGVAMPQISTAEIKRLKVPLLSDDEKDQVMENYTKEVELYKELEKIEESIKKLHGSYLQRV